VRRRTRRINSNGTRPRQKMMP